VGQRPRHQCAMLCLELRQPVTACRGINFQPELGITGSAHCILFPGQYYGDFIGDPYDEYMVSNSTYYIVTNNSNYDAMSWGSRDCNTNLRAICELPASVFACPPAPPPSPPSPELVAGPLCKQVTRSVLEAGMLGRGLP
jgi:hypothetical protein